MIIREHEPLCRHTTLRTGGPARFFIEARTEQEIRDGLQFAADQGLPVFVLGGGSNVLAPDAGFPGAVLHLETRGITGVDLSQDATEVLAEAGENWDQLVAWTVERGLHGLENMSLIPGTVGAAVVGNIGAYGAEVKDTLLWAEAMDLHTGTARRFNRQECEFAYRWSFFKTSAGRGFIVLRAAFSLARTAPLNAGYRDVADFFATSGTISPTLANIREAIMTIRQRKLPDLSQVGTAGSFFKNPVISKALYESLVMRYPGLPGHPDGPDRVKVPLGWILDKACSLKGFRLGRVATHRDQALVLVNEGGNSAEVEALARLAAERVKQATDISVEWEVERLEAGTRPPAESTTKP